jgi:hypothetical protein
MTSQVRPRWTKPVGVMERPVRRNDWASTAYLIRDSGATGHQWPHAPIAKSECMAATDLASSLLAPAPSWKTRHRDKGPLWLHGRCPHCTGIGHEPAYWVGAASRVRFAGLRPPLTRSRVSSDLKHQRQLPPLARGRRPCMTPTRQFPDRPPRRAAICSRPPAFIHASAAFA